MPGTDTSCRCRAGTAGTAPPWRQRFSAFPGPRPPADLNTYQPKFHWHTAVISIRGKIRTRQLGPSRSFYRHGKHLARQGLTLEEVAGSIQEHCFSSDFASGAGRP
jgi:hypothetical protein